MIDKVQIGIIQHRVRTVPDLHDVAEEGKKRILWGQISEKDSEIRLRKGTTRSRKQVTLVHEILHGILNNASMENQPEDLIDCISFGIIQVLRDNPKLVDYLLKK